MRKITSCFILIFLFSLAMAANLAAGTWPNLEKSLESWPGPKEVQILVEAGDPLGSAELLPLIEICLKYNFAVNTSAQQTASGTGLLVEVRRGEPQTMIILKRASDNAVIALDRSAGSARLAAVPSPPPPQPAPQVVPPAPARQHAPIPLDGAPVSLVWLDRADDNNDGNLALLSGAGVTLYRLQGKQLQKRSVTAPPKKGLRPLTLSRGDLDSDGSFELAAVWAEDIYSVYDGTDSKIWSQLLTFEQQKLTPLGLQPGYVRLFPSAGMIQQRGVYSPFSGPVKKLLYRQRQFSTGPALPWGGQDIFTLTPWNDGSGLARMQQGALSRLSLKSGKQLPGGMLLENFGVMQTAQIAVRLETPEFLYGFGKEDRVLETYISLTPRLIRDDDDSMLTIDRGRKSGTILLGPAEGADRLAQLKKYKDELILEYPFAPVKSFIIDFAMLPGKDVPTVLLLLNEKEDASGQAFLLYQ